MENYYLLHFTILLDCKFLILQQFYSSLLHLSNYQRIDGRNKSFNLISIFKEQKKME